MIRRYLAVLLAVALAFPPVARAADVVQQAPVTFDGSVFRRANGKISSYDLLLYVNASAYGVTCDGSTTNTTVLQAAADAAQALGSPGTSNGGGALYMPPGFCKVTGTINIVSGVTIVGAGTGLQTGTGNSGGTIIRTNSGTADVFAVASNGAVTFKDLQIDSSVTRTAGAGISITGPDAATANIGSRLENVRIAGMYNAVALTNAGEWRITDSRFIDYVNDAVLVTANSTFADGAGGGGSGISNTSFRALNTAATCNAGYEFQAGGSVSIVGSKFLGCNYNVLVALTQSTGTLLLSANGMEESNTANIGVTQTTAAKTYGNITVTGSELSNLSSGGANLIISAGSAPGWVKNISVNGNVINNGSGAVAAGYFQINDGNGVEFSGNTTYGGGATGTSAFAVGSAATNVEIAKSNISYNLPAGLFKPGGVYWPAILPHPPAPNMFINPELSIDQSSEGAATTLAATTNYCVDGWAGTRSAASGAVVTCQRSSDAPPGGTNSVIATVTTAGATTSTDFATLFQRVESNVLSALGFGTANAVPQISLSSWVKTSLAGTYTLRVINGATNNYAWLYPCTVTANTWTKCATVIPGDTAGTWAGSPYGMTVQWILEAGSSENGGTANAWNAAALSKIGTSAQTNWTDTLSATFQIGLPKLEVSWIPTQFAADQPSVALTKAARYYAKTFPQGTAPAQSAGLAGALCQVGASTTAGSFAAMWRFPVEMRTSPTIVTYNPSAANANWRNVTGAADATVSVDPPTAKGTTGVLIGEQTTAPAVASSYCIHASANARL